MFKHLFSADYLFGPTLPGLHLSDKLYFQVGLLLVVLGLALAFFRRNLSSPVKKHLLGRWQHLALTVGLLAVFWAGLRYELVRFFSMHFMVWLIYATGLVWAVFILIYWRGEYKHRHEVYEKEELKKKYM